jgi:hypothetical protein
MARPERFDSLTYCLGGLRAMLPFQIACKLTSPGPSR